MSGVLKPDFMFMSKRLNRAEVAEFFGKSLPTIDRWVKLGCPVVQRGGRGREWQFDSAAVHDWHVQWKLAQAQGSIDQSDLEELRRRKLLAETTLLEAELETNLRKLAPVAHMRRAMASMGALVQQKMLMLPFRLESQLVGETDSRRVRAVLEAEIRQALNDAADTAQAELTALVSQSETDADDETDDDFSTEGAGHE